MAIARPCVDLFQKGCQISDNPFSDEFGDNHLARDLLLQVSGRFQPHPLQIRIGSLGHRAHLKGPEGRPGDAARRTQFGLKGLECFSKVNLDFGQIGAERKRRKVPLVFEPGQLIRQVFREISPEDIRNPVIPGQLPIPLTTLPFSNPSEQAAPPMVIIMQVLK